MSDPCAKVRQWKIDRRVLLALFGHSGVSRSFSVDADAMPDDAQVVGVEMDTWGVITLLIQSDRWPQGAAAQISPKVTILFDGDRA